MRYPKTYQLRTTLVIMPRLSSYAMRDDQAIHIFLIFVNTDLVRNGFPT